MSKIVKEMAAALAALEGKGPDDILAADTMALRLCKCWVRRELCPGGTLDLETTEEYAAAYLAAKGEKAVQDLFEGCEPIRAARRLICAIAHEETAGDRERAQKAKDEAVKAAKYYCRMHPHGNGFFGVYQRKLRELAPELDADEEWFVDGLRVDEFVLNMHNI